jgi:hypothetical protein
LSDRFYKLDSDIAVAGKKFRVSRAEGLKELQRLSQEAQLLHTALPEELAKVVSQTAQK